MMTKRIGLADTIDRRVKLLKIHRGYLESDHILAIAYNSLAGGRCLDDMERLRQDEALLDSLGAPSLPDPTTAGDFCRRFKSAEDIDKLQGAINETRLRVLQRQSPEFLEEARIDGDGSIVETQGECKEGMDMSYKGTWGYQPLLISLANTQEPLFVVNRSGNEAPQEGAAVYFDKAIQLCKDAGFKRIVARGDTAFSQTEHLDRWDDEGVHFIFGYAGYKNLEKKAEGLPAEEWMELTRTPKYEVSTTTRQRPENVKQRIVEKRGYTDLRLLGEDVADFRYRPTRCQKQFRMVVVRKTVETRKGQKRLFEEYRYLYYITNDFEMSALDVVLGANQRCAQEKLIGELKSGVGALRAPVDNLESNWAWMGLLLSAKGRWAEKHEEDRQQIIRMGFRGFVERMMRVPVQVVLSGKQIHVRLLSWNPLQRVFLRCADLFEGPALC
jgi:hypothetical protein